MLNPELIPKILAGDPRSIARAITLVENGGNDASSVMKAVFPHTGKAQLSELPVPPVPENPHMVDKLALFYREKATNRHRCIDPRAHFPAALFLATASALATLGLDKKCIYPGSMATRGNLAVGSGRRWMPWLYWMPQDSKKLS